MCLPKKLPIYANDTAPFQELFLSYLTLLTSAGQSCLVVPHLTRSPLALETP